MISKQFFCSVLTAIKLQEEKDNRIGQAINVFSENDIDGLNNNTFVYTTYLNQAIQSALEIEMHDEEEWISWFMYETEWGTRMNEIYQNGKVIARIDSIEKLYDYIIDSR